LPHNGRDGAGEVQGMADKKNRNGEFWELALERAHLGVWDWDLASGDCFYSAMWSQMLGYGEGELVETSDLWLQLTHPDDRERAVASGERHIAGQTDLIETELRLKHKSDHWVWVLDRGGVVERDAEGRPLRLMGVQTDITKQKQAEHALEQVNVRFRLALAASGTGIWHHDLAARKMARLQAVAARFPAGHRSVARQRKSDPCLRSRTSRPDAGADHGAPGRRADRRTWRPARLAPFAADRFA
jgi:PAS domain S-box-containing protein